MKSIDNDTCPKRQLSDSVEHLFINREYTVTLWTLVEKWINSISFLNSKIDNKIEILDRFYYQWYIAIQQTMCIRQQRVKIRYSHLSCKKNIEKIYSDKRYLTDCFGHFRSRWHPVIAELERLR